MKKGTLIFALLIFLALNVTSVLAYDTSEYLEEFSNNGETCDAIDIFEYNQYDPQWWSANHFSQTIPVFYYCCKEDYCTTIIVDLKNKQLMKDDYYLELIDLNYIKYSMNVGNLTKTSFVSKGLDSCHYHGQDKLNQESLNLVADTAETIALTQKTKQAKQIVDAVRTARALEIVSPVSLADLGISVACHYNDKKIKVAIEKIAECNLYLSHIQNNYAQTGYVYILDTCLDEARENFKEYRETDVAKIKNVADKTINIFAAIFNFFKDLFENPTNLNADFKVEKTEYEIAGEIYDEIKDKKLYLHNPHKNAIFEKYAKRIIQKRNDYNKTKINTSLAYAIAYKNKPNMIKLFFSDIFNEPNYNLSEANQLYTNAKVTYKSCETMYAQVKYNSAIKCMNIAKQGFDASTDIFKRENLIERSFDERWENALIIIGILIAIGWLAKKYMLRA
jgi:hypothetical protein